MTREPQEIWRDADPDDLAGMEIVESRAGQTSCPPPELVHALGAGTLSPDLEGRVAAHVARCGTCRTLIAALDDPSVGELTADEQQRILERVHAGVDLATRDSRRRTWRWAAAAFVTLAGAGSVFVWQARSPSADPPAPAVERNPLAGPQALATSYRLSGVVTNAAGEPLEGVTVGEYVQRPAADPAVGFRTPFSATTDAAGRYSVSGAPLSRGRTTALRASKLGYFSANTGVSISSDMRADFRLTPWKLVSLDEVVKDTLSTDTVCGTAPEPCRQFAVSVPRSGTLEVSLVTPVRDRMDLWLETPNGDVLSPTPGNPLRLAAAVFAGSVCQITVVNNGSDSRQFELTMRLR